MKRQAEKRVREYLAEPLRAQAQAAMIEDEDDAQEPRRRIPEPL